MKTFRFMLRKDLRLWLICTIAIMLFSGIVQSVKYLDVYDTEPYYSKAFSQFSEKKDFATAVSEKSSELNKNSDDAFTEIFNIMYGENFDPSKPPVVVPSELVEKLFLPDKHNGEYSPDVDTDIAIFSQLNKQIQPQSSYKAEVEEQLENYDRNVRRGIKDEYILALAKHLTEDYTKVLETDLEKPVDTRGANILSDFIREDFIAFIAIFILLFHIFSSEIQSGRYAQFSISKYGAKKFARAKILSGFVQTILFCVCYCAEYFVIFFVFSKDNSVLSAPVQVLTNYDLSSEDFTVFTYLLCIMGIRLMYCLAVCSVIMLVSYLCKRTILAGGIGIVFTAIPLVISKTYDLYNCEPDKSKLKIILSCDIFNMFHSINYVNILGTPIKLYWVYMISIATVIIVVTLFLLVFSAKRGAVNV